MAWRRRAGETYYGGVRIVENSSVDGVIFDEVKHKFQGLVAIDSLFLSGFLQSVIAGVRFDSVFMKETQLKELIKFSKEDIIFIDTILKMRASSIPENVLLSDQEFALRVKNSLSSDVLSINDIHMKWYLKDVRDFLLTYDWSELPSVIVSIMTDGLFITDPLTVDKMVVKLIVDLLLTADQTTRICFKELLSIDQVLLSDTRQMLMEKRIEERIALTESVIKLIGGIFRDDTLTSDSVVVDLGGLLATRLVNDQVIFSDVLRELKQGVLVDNLLLLDNKIVDLEKKLLDHIQITDVEQVSKSLFAVLLDNLLLYDSEVHQRLKQIDALDSLLIFDLRLASELSKITSDSVLTSTQILKILETSKFEQLFLGDEISSTIIGAIIAYLIYARMQEVNYMNITQGSNDFIGRVIGVGPLPRVGE